MIAAVQLAIDPTMRNLCRAPYPGHKSGCPNWNKKPECPPMARPIGELIDLDKTVFAVWNCFDLGRHIRKLQEKHPHWSERQLYCCLYWQGTARKQLKKLIIGALVDLLAENPDRQLCTLKCPEACDVNVTKTMLDVGVELEWPLRKYAYQVAIIGHKKG